MPSEVLTDAEALSLVDGTGMATALIVVPAWTGGQRPLKGQCRHTTGLGDDGVRAGSKHLL